MQFSHSIDTYSPNSSLHVSFTQKVHKRNTMESTMPICQHLSWN